MARAAGSALVVGVAGGSGSGKTTLCRALRESLGADRCAYLDHDSYYRDLSHLTLRERAMVNFDHPRSLENELLRLHLQAMKLGRAAPKPRYDFATHTRLGQVDWIPPRAVVLVDGILLLGIPELRSCLDLRIYVDAPEDLRLERRVRRDVRERGRTPESVVRQFHMTVRPMHRLFVEPGRAQAHVVVSGAGALEREVAAVLRSLGSHEQTA